MPDGERLLARNARRRARLDTTYNPMAGIGSPIERFELDLGRSVVHLPVAMEELPIIEEIREAGSLGKWCRHNKQPYEPSLNAINLLRLRYDFEFWCASACTIKSKTGERIKLVPNRPQRQMIEKLEGQRQSGEPVRLIVLKHRQWGSTTLTCAYIAWHQLVLHEGRDAWFIGHDKDASREVISRYERIRKHYEFDTLSMEPHQGMDRSMKIPERRATLSVGTVREPNAPSGRTPHFFHLFEIGKWPSNPKHSAERVVQNVESMVVDEPGTAYILESTLEGQTGVYYKELCDRARKGDTEHEFLFVSWLDDPQYQRELPSYEASDVAAWASEWSDYDRGLWENHKATLEQIRWYQRQRTKPGYTIEPWRLMQEFPTTVSEALQHGDSRVFPSRYVEAARTSCKEPHKTGRLLSREQTGRGALMGITFETDPGGPVKVWREPGATYGGLLDDTYIRRRYAAASDVAPGQTSDASYSCTVIVDRAPILFGGQPEIAAEWHGREDPDLYAWAAARLCAWYAESGNIWWGPEVNSLLSGHHRHSGDPDFGNVLIKEVKGRFPGKIYKREVFDRSRGEVVEKVGWFTDTRTKPMIVSQLQKNLRGIYRSEAKDEETGLGYVERSYAACDEMDAFIRKGGSMEAAQKKYDDRLIARGIALYLSEQWAPPKYEEKTVRRAPQPTKPSAAKI